jgi:drug/metabolite transporter (DMT)-like permease
MINILGQLFALLTSACWAHNSLAYSAAGKRVGSDAVTHIRLWIAFPVIILVNLLFTGTLLPADLSSQSFFFLAVSGVVGFFLADIFIFRAFVDLGPRETLVILTLSPIVSALFSWILLKEALTPLQILGIFVTLGGVIAVTLAENRDARALGIRKPLAGLVFALLGTVSQSAAMILSKQGLEGGIHPVTANQIRIGFGLISMVLYTVLRGTFFSDFRKMKDRTALKHITTGALIGPVLGIILTLYALRLAPVGIATTLMQMSPVLLLPVERFVFHKKIPAGAVAGTLLAVMGAVLLFIT